MIRPRRSRVILSHTWLHPRLPQSRQTGGNLHSTGSYRAHAPVLEGELRISGSPADIVACTRPGGTAPAAFVSRLLFRQQLGMPPYWQTGVVIGTNGRQ